MKATPLKVWRLTTVAGGPAAYWMRVAPVATPMPSQSTSDLHVSVRFPLPRAGEGGARQRAG